MDKHERHGLNFSNSIETGGNNTLNIIGVLKENESTFHHFNESVI